LNGNSIKTSRATTDPDRSSGISESDRAGLFDHPVCTEDTNYVKTALGALAKGEPVTHASTLPYGCSVKY